MVWLPPFLHLPRFDSFSVLVALQVIPGMPLVYQPYVFGRNPKYWGEDALEFKPERWLNDAGEVRQESEGKFPQFNGGPRCSSSFLMCVRACVCEGVGVLGCVGVWE